MSSSGNLEPGAAPTPGLLILTGASHTGKTTVAKAVLDIVDVPAAFLSVDDVLTHTISRPPGDPWAQIPLAYDLLEPQAATLIERGWFVVLESTFTYVPETGTAEFHQDRLLKLIEIAERRPAPWVLIQLNSRAEEIETRARGTGRIREEIAIKTIDLHASAALPDPAIRLDSTSVAPAKLALGALAAFDPKSRV